MDIKHIKICHFRGIDSLEWHVAGRFVCLIGPGDSTKSTVLDAIELVLTPRRNVSFDDADFYNADTNNPIIIEIATGEVPVPSKRLNPEQAAVRDPAVTADTKVMGPAVILDRVVDELALDRVLRKAFPETWRQILCMAYCIAVRGGPLSYCESWSYNHDHPYGRSLSSQRISDILKSLSADGQKTFFKE